MIGVVGSTVFSMSMRSELSRETPRITSWKVTPCKLGDTGFSGSPLQMSSFLLSMLQKGILTLSS